MTYEVVVGGAGLAGMTAAVRAAEDGLRVMVLAKGYGATHLAPPTIDVLGYAPDRVEAPGAALPGFVREHPDHPYARLPEGTVERALGWLSARVGRYVGDLSANLLLPTAVGVARPSAAAPDTMAAGDVRTPKRLVIAGLSALKDFYPRLVCDNLTAAGVVAQARPVTLSPPTDGERDYGALRYARRFPAPEFRSTVVRQLRPELSGVDAVGLPAVLGFDEAPAIWSALQDALGVAVFEIPTLPPSVPGMRLFNALLARLRAAGGRLVVGSKVLGGQAGNGRVEAVRVHTSARDVLRPAGSVVLATGGFATGGLDLDSAGRVREAVLDLPVWGLPEHVESAFGAGYFDDHPMSRVGLRVDEAMRPLDGTGRPAYENVYAVGALLGGATPWQEKSGHGISLATGLRAAEAIVERTRG